MKIRRIIFFCLCIFLFAGKFSAQKYLQKTDSLKGVLKTALSDTQRVRLLSLLSEIYSSNKNKECYACANEAITLSKKTKNGKAEITSLLAKSMCEYNFGNLDSSEKILLQLKFILDSLQPEMTYEKGRTYFMLGKIYHDKEQLMKALSFLDKAEELFIRVNNKRFIGSVYIMQGLCYWNTDKLDKALDRFIKATDNKREIKDLNGLAASLGNLGLVYEDLQLHDKSIYYHKESVRINREIKNREGLINELNNLGISYYGIRSLDTSEKFIREALDLATEDSAKGPISRCYNNLGLIYDAKGNPGAALSFYERSLKIKEELNSIYGMSGAHINIGAIQTKRKNYPEAEKHLKLALDLAKQAESLERQKEACEGLYEVFNQTNRPALALEWYVRAVKLKDSIFNNGNNKIIAEMNEKFESDQKDRMLEKQKEDAVVKQLEFEKEHSSKIYSYGLALFAVLISIGAFWAFFQKRKGNKLLAIKNAAIETQKQEITDSINYAQRIQQAILPSHAEMKILLPDHAIFYKPKDIVAGDFYWFTVVSGFGFPVSGSDSTNQKQETRNGEVMLLAAADCTGHGVPGAFMSLIGKENLDKAAQKFSEAGKILSHLNRSLKAALHQTVRGDAMQDGMDISIIALDQNAKLRNEKDTTKIKFSGANRPLWILNSTKKENPLREILGTKAAIGGDTPENQVFEETEITIEKNDCVYLFTDGFADQFGGPNEKKLTTKRFRVFLSEICHLTAKEQVDKIDDFFIHWKKDIQQVDDILIIVLKF